MKDRVLIEIKELQTRLGNQWVHKDITLAVHARDIFVIAGGSGCGKTVLLRAMLNLVKPTRGTIRVFNHCLNNISPTVLQSIQHRWGVLFQQNALFSSLTILENIIFPLRELTTLPLKQQHELGMLMLALVGLPSTSAHQYPNELSGGMQKRAALARALILNPELLFLDEPTAGLDPASVFAFDQLILNLQATMGLTILVVTHDIESIRRIANKIAFLGEGTVLSLDSFAKTIEHPHPLIQQFFNTALQTPTHHENFYGNEC